MVKEGALDAPKPEAVFGLHVALGVDVGQIGYTEGAIMASSDSFTIEVQGKTVHGALPHLGLDPVPVAAEIVEALQLIHLEGGGRAAAEGPEHRPHPGRHALQHHRRPRGHGRHPAHLRPRGAHRHEGPDDAHGQGRGRGARPRRHPALHRRRQRAHRQRRGARPSLAAEGSRPSSARTASSPSAR